MNSIELSALLLLTTAASFSPGPNTTLSTALAANFGLRHALGFVFAVPVGWGLLFSLCAAGVGALILALPLLRLAVTAVGVSYLIWLAWRLSGLRFEWRSRSWSQAPVHWHSAGTNLNITFWQGVLLQFLNIKAWMLALTVVAGWIAARPDAAQRFMVVLPLMLMFGLLSNLSYALLGSLLRDWLVGPDNSGRRLRWFNRSMALVLLFTALWMSRF